MADADEAVEIRQLFRAVRGTPLAYAFKVLGAEQLCMKLSKRRDSESDRVSADLFKPRGLLPQL